MPRLFFNLLLLTIAIKGLAQPYGGTIFIEPDIIVTSDSSALESVNYVGKELKTVFDRRVNEWVSADAFVFDVFWNDGLSSEALINLEFNSPELAQIF